MEALTDINFNGIAWVALCPTCNKWIEQVKVCLDCNTSAGIKDYVYCQECNTAIARSS